MTSPQANDARLKLGVLAYNMMNYMKRLALPPKVRHWSLPSIQLKLVKIGAVVVRHARKICFRMAQVGVGRDLVSRILQRIQALEPAPC